MLNFNINTVNKLNELKGQLDNKENNNKLINAKVEIKDLDINKQTKQVKIEVNTNDKNIHSNTDNMYRKENNIDLNNIKRGEILYVDIDQKGIGSEQAGIRYSVCLQNDIGNKFSPTIIVAFITSRLTKSRIPTHVEIAGGNFGLPKDSVVLLEQVRTLDKRRIIKRVGKVDELTLLKIDKAKDISMGNLKPKTDLERLPQKVQELINDKLEDIKSIERTICTIVNNDEYLKKNLYGQRECYLASLERICKKYNLNYHDYYTMYKREKEDERFVV